MAVWIILRFDLISNILQVFKFSMNLEDQKRFAKTIKPFFTRFVITNLHLEFASSDVIRMFLELLEGQTIQDVLIVQEESENID